MSSAIEEYFEALERLKKNKPLVVPFGSKINNDTVALEAGRKRGTIKKSRGMFAELIAEIESIGEKIDEPKVKAETALARYKEEAKRYKQLYEESLNRELMLIEKLNEQEKLLNKRPNGAVNNV